MSCYHVSVRIHIIEKIRDSRCERGGSKERTLEHCWREYKWVHLGKTVFWLLRKLKMELPHDTIISPLGLNSKEINSRSWKDIHLHSHPYGSLTHTSQETNSLVDEQIKETIHYIFTVEYFSHQKKETKSFVIWPQYWEGGHPISTNTLWHDLSIKSKPAELRNHVVTRD